MFNEAASFLSCGLVLAGMAILVNLGVVSVLVVRRVMAVTFISWCAEGDAGNAFPMYAEVEEVNHCHCEAGVAVLGSLFGRRDLDLMQDEELDEESSSSSASMPAASRYTELVEVQAQSDRFWLLQDILEVSEYTEEELEGATLTELRYLWAKAS